MAGSGELKTPSRTLWRASYNTRNFSFDAFGETKIGAKAALRLGLKHHANEFNLAHGWEGKDKFQLDEIELGVAYRDAERIK